MFPAAYHLLEDSSYHVGCGLFLVGIEIAVQTRDGDLFLNILIAESFDN